MADNGAFVRNIAEVPWREFPNHFGGALSKPLVMPETAGSRHIDYRISMYQPMAHVARHKHKVQEQVYHVLEGEGLMEIGKHGITINSIPPGRIMSEQIRRNYPPDYRERFAEEEIPVRYWGEPEDLAALAVFLASPKARYITGTVIPVDGGLRRY